MDTPRARHKLDEAGFFLQHLGKEREGDPAAFGYFLSAFLNAAYSLVKLLEVEVKRELKKDAENKKKAKAAFGPWYESWVKNLSREEHELWVLMEAQRRDEVHLLGAETVKETKAIPLEPPRDNPALFYSFMGNSPALFSADDAWREELRRLGLPPWTRVWREAQVHHFEVAGERRDVVETCRRYLALLDRLLNDIHKSMPFTATPGGSATGSIARPPAKKPDKQLDLPAPAPAPPMRTSRWQRLSPLLFSGWRSSQYVGSHEGSDSPPRG